MTTDAPATTQRVIRMAAHPAGALDDNDFEMVDAPVPEPADGEALVRTLYLSLDPAIRVWMNGVDTYVPGIQIGDAIRAGGLGEVVVSRSPEYREGDLVFGMMQWSDYFIARAGPDGMMTVPRQDPVTAYLSVLGVTGLTAYFGMLDVGQAKEGETVVVSGAAGAAGSVAGQIAKIIGCRVVGIAGGPEKCRVARRRARLRRVDRLQGRGRRRPARETCPDGIDVFFDNVGGEILDAVLGQINLHARVVLCGAISQYDTAERARAAQHPQSHPAAGTHGGVHPPRLPGPVPRRHPPARAVGAGRAHQVRRGHRRRLGERAAAFRKLFSGQNTGKLIVRVAPE